jgi:tetratricopeptide (TPR) repeat protein
MGRLMISRLLQRSRSPPEHLATSFALGPGRRLGIFGSIASRRLEETDRRLERALALDPGLAYAWVRRGWMSTYLGDNETAIRELSTALHLMPFQPLRHLSFIAWDARILPPVRRRALQQPIRLMPRLHETSRLIRSG